jgi:hypothetical protein
MIDAAAFRRLALALPGVSEQAHRGHPDFRVGRRVFATLDYPGPGWAMVRLSPEEQAVVCEATPVVFSRVKGGWGRGGATLMALGEADEATAASALAMAHRLGIAKS